MISKIGYNIIKSQFGRKIRNDGYLLLSLYINWSITKKFLIKALLKRIYSSIKNLEKFEYDK